MAVTTLSSTASGLTSYRATDPVEESLGVVYYRIRYQQFGEADSYSPIVTLSRKGGERLSVRAYPNPTDGPLYLHIEGALYGPIFIRVSDAMGRSVLAQQSDASSQVIELAEFAGLPRGLYLIRVSDAAGNTWTGRVVKP